MREKAPEFPRGTLKESEALDTAKAWLGPGSQEIGPGRHLSEDGLRQVRYGKHEVSSKKHHIHFEAYDQPARAGGKIVETSTAEIIPDASGKPGG